MPTLDSLRFWQSSGMERRSTGGELLPRGSAPSPLSGFIAVVMLGRALKKED